MTAVTEQVVQGGTLTIRPLQPTIGAEISDGFGHCPDGFDSQLTLYDAAGTVLVGDSGKLRRLTGWQPETSFRGMIEKMLEHARKTNP